MVKRAALNFLFFQFRLKKIVTVLSMNLPSVTAWKKGPYGDEIILLQIQN